jgi:hypothetical protein
MTLNIDIVGSLKLIAYAPLEYGYKVSKIASREPCIQNLEIGKVFIEG